MKSLLKFTIVFALIFSFACSHKAALVVNRNKVIYDKKNKEKYHHIAKQTAGEKNSPSSTIEVSSGDTLYSFAKKYHVTLRDLIKQNNLTPPYALKKGDRLIVPIPSYHEVKVGDTLYSISRLHNMQVNQIIEINNLQKPYALKVGDKIRINKFNEDKSPTSENKKLAQSKETNFIPTENSNLIEKTLDKLNHFSWPVRGTLISKFGPKSGGLYNDGINIAATEGEAIKAAEDGVVAYVGNELKGYGNLIIIKHSGGWITAYAHLKDTAVQRAQKIAKGQKIGSVGSSGNVTSPQLYFGLRKGRDAVNPENYLTKS